MHIFGEPRRKKGLDIGSLYHASKSGSLRVVTGNLPKDNLWHMDVSTVRKLEVRSRKKKNSYSINITGATITAILGQDLKFELMNHYFYFLTVHNFLAIYYSS